MESDMTPQPNICPSCGKPFSHQFDGTKEQQMVLRFHQRFGLTVNERPAWPSCADRELREQLIDEELKELKGAVTLTDVADALGDLLYVVYGAAVTYGINLEPIFAEIHRSNMTKLWNGSEVRRNEFGKVIKPPTYSPADIESEIQRQSAR